MAINPETEYPGKITAASAAYPFGSARNVTAPGDGTGTPFIDTLVNDIFGLQQALLDAAAATPTGNPDQVGASQYLDAWNKLFGSRIKYYATLAAVVADPDLIDTAPVVIGDRANGLFDVVTGETPDTFEIVQCTGTAFQLKLRIVEPVNVKQRGAVGDGVANDTAALGGKGYAPEGTYLVDDNHPTDEYFGEGVIKKSYGLISLSPSNNPAQRTTMSEAVMSTINPRGLFIDGNYAYICNQGTYNATDQGVLTIVDIRDPYNATIISTTNIGGVGDTPRALSVKASILYVQQVGGVLSMFDITDRATPTLISTKTLNTGNREYSTVYGDTLIIPKQTGDEVDFYTLRNPTDPDLVATLSATGSFYQPILDGDLMWVASHNDGTAANLLCIDISDVRNPTTVSFTTHATLKFARRGVIRGKYLYMGGFDSTSRLNVIDISDPTAPVVVFTHATETGAYVETSGNLLFADTNAYDITDPTDPILSDTFSDIVSRPQAVGAYLIGFGPGTGPQGPAGNDGNEDPTLRISRISNYSVTSLSTGSIQTERAFADDLVVTNRVKAGAMDAGAGGVSTTGRMSATRMSAGGVIDNSSFQSESMRVVNGDISSNTNIFSIAGNNMHISLELHYTLIDNQALASTAAHTVGVKNFSTFISGAGASLIRIPIGDMVTERTIGTASVLTVTITNGTATTPILIGVSAPQLNIANSRALFRIKVISSEGKLNLLQV